MNVLAMLEAAACDPAVTLPPGASLAEQLAGKLPAAREQLLGALKQFGSHLLASWEWLAREAQKPPPGDWTTWLIMAGRGFGKTRAGAEWVRARAEIDPRARIALVGATLAEARAVMVEGESGLLAIAPDQSKPKWEPSLRRLCVWVRAMDLWVRRDAGGWTDGALSASAIRIAGEQVVGRRQPAIAAPIGGLTIDGEARAAIASVVLVLQSHGLVAS